MRAATAHGLSRDFDFVNSARSPSRKRHRSCGCSGTPRGAGIDPQLLARKPDFLWPSSAPLVELAKKNTKVLNDQVISNSPIVVYSWESIAEGLVKVGMATREAAHYRIDAKALIQAVLDSKPWSDLGQTDLYGHVRLIATDPNKSNSGFMFAGLAADILTGDVANAASLPKVLPQVVALFEAMGFKSHSSGQVAGRMPAQVTDVAPMPDVDTMLAILDGLSVTPAQPASPAPAEPSNDAVNGA
jgi:hypothetical protein